MSRIDMYLIAVLGCFYLLCPRIVTAQGAILHVKADATGAIRQRLTGRSAPRQQGLRARISFSPCPCSLLRQRIRLGRQNSGLEKLLVP